MNRYTLGVLVILLTTTALPGTAGDVVEIHLRGRYFSAPATVQVTVAVEPDAANRLLSIEADGDRVYRSTEVELSGVTDRRLHMIEFKNLPEGAYQLRAQVLSRDHVRGTARQELIVAGIGGK